MIPERLKRVFLSLLLSRGIMAIRQLLMVPVFIRVWGVEYYGEWLAVSAIPSFLAMSNLGLGTAAGIGISIDVAAGKYASAWRTFVSISGLLIALSIAMLIPALGAAWAYSHVGWGTRHVESVALVFVTLAATAMSRLVVPVWNGWWVGAGRAASANHWNNLYALVELLIGFAVLWWRADALFFSCALLFWNLIWLAAYFYATASQVRARGITLGIYLAEWKEVKKLLGVGIGHQLCPLWQAILFQGSILLATYILGPAGAALWGALRVMARSVNQILELISQSLGPEYQLAYAEGDWDKLRQLHSAGLVSSVGLASACALCLGIFGLPIFHVWTNKQFVVPTHAWALLIGSLIPCAFWWSSQELQRSLNLPWFVNLWGSVAALISLSIMSVSAYIGITGFGLGTLVFECMMSLAVLRKSCDLLNESFVSAISRGAILTRSYCQRLLQPS